MRFLTAVHWTFAGLFLGSFVLVAADAPFVAAPGKAGWPEAALVVTAAISTLISLSRQLPVQNVLWVATIIAAGSTLTQAVGTFNAVPFNGPFAADPVVPGILTRIPWWIPFLWLIILLNSRGSARVILRPWRQTRFYGFWLFGVTIALCLVFNLGLAAFDARRGRPWPLNPAEPGWWWGGPVSRWLGWMIATLLILAAATPVLINKQPTEFPPDFHPVALWVLLNSLLVIGALAPHSWPSAIPGSLALLVLVGFAVRGAIR